MSKEAIVEVVCPNEGFYAIPVSKIHMVIKKDFGNANYGPGAVIIGNFKYPEYKIDGSLETATPYDDIVTMMHGAKKKIITKEVKTALRAVINHDSIDGSRMEYHVDDIKKHIDACRKVHEDIQDGAAWYQKDSYDVDAPSSVQHMHQKIRVTVYEKKVIEESK